MRKFPTAKRRKKKRKEKRKPIIPFLSSLSWRRQKQEWQQQQEKKKRRRSRMRQKPERIRKKKIIHFAKLSGKIPESFQLLLGSLCIPQEWKNEATPRGNPSTRGIIRKKE
ncbi:hypothetical protein RUM43_005417 [Polyplax serrata]|uniref:Uncharacterized protein n=1 Tax=Polyplax serrata TaxID=468196 RepID=A0AAN8P988_POLSC